MRITNKAQMYDLLERGLLGNHLRVFRTDEELLGSGFDGRVGVRCIGEPGSTYYHHLTVAQALTGASLMRSEGFDVVYQESALDHMITLQGGVCCVDGILCLTYSRAKTHMREALKNSKTAFGLEARTILQTYVDPSSMDDIELILETYKDHVLEFTAFSGCVGRLKGRNTCIWEVRLY